MKNGYICPVCGKTTSNVKGFMKHPICFECHNNPEKRKIWMQQLRKYHPNLYHIAKVRK